MVIPSIRTYIVYIDSLLPKSTPPFVGSIQLWDAATLLFRLINDFQINCSKVNVEGRRRFRPLAPLLAYTVKFVGNFRIGF